MNTINLEFATKCGENMATELNKTPNDAQNWAPLERGDDVPEFDYIELRTHYGDVFEENSIEIERAYKAGFNAVFVPLNGDDE
jgi:hypothetical protein